jgi:hypothetical protein
MKYPLTPRRNGLDMVTVKLEADVTLGQIAAHVTCELAYEIDHLSQDQLDGEIRKRLKSRQAAMALVKNSLLVSGSELPQYQVSDNPTCDAIYPYVLAVINELWS